MTSPLENLCGRGKPLTRESPDEREFSGLKRSALARLKDARNTGNSLESRFDLAYNAAHALALAALRRAGYRSANRYIVFQVLPHTLGLGPDVWRVLAKCHLRSRGRLLEAGCSPGGNRKRGLTPISCHFSQVTGGPFAGPL